MKSKIVFEYPFKNASVQILWMMIGTPLGLAEWFSDGVTVAKDEFTFSWDDNYETAVLINKKELKYIQFQWEEDKGTDAYFEMRILQPDLSNSVSLQITEFIEENNVEEENDLKLLWDKHVEDLGRKIGI
jgi:hypothetical protein